jgi:hypothetical protein
MFKMPRNLSSMEIVTIVRKEVTRKLTVSRRKEKKETRMRRPQAMPSNQKTVRKMKVKLY